MGQRYRGARGSERPLQNFSAVRTGELQPFDSSALDAPDDLLAATTDRRPSPLDRRPTPVDGDL
jgi:hypothetical protein